MKNTGSQVKPWHIILFTLALLLVIWQAFSYVQQKRQTQTTLRQEGQQAPTINQYTPPQFQRIRQRMEEEK